MTDLETLLRDKLRSGGPTTAARLAEYAYGYGFQAKDYQRVLRTLQALELAGEVTRSKHRDAVTRGNSAHTWSAVEDPHD